MQAVLATARMTTGQRRIVRGRVSGPALRAPRARPEIQGVDTEVVEGHHHRERKHALLRRRPRPLHFPSRGG